MYQVSLHIAIPNAFLFIENGDSKICSIFCSKIFDITTDNQPILPLTSLCFAVVKGISIIKELRHTTLTTLLITLASRRILGVEQHNNKYYSLRSPQKVICEFVGLHNLRYHTNVALSFTFSL